MRTALLAAGLLLAAPPVARAEDARLCLAALAPPWDERDLAAALSPCRAGDALRLVLTRGPTGFRPANRDDTLTIAGLVCALQDGAVLADAEILLCRYRGELRQPRQ